MTIFETQEDEGLSSAPSRLRVGDGRLLARERHAAPVIKSYGCMRSSQRSQAFRGEARPALAGEQAGDGAAGMRKREAEAVVEARREAEYKAADQGAAKY